MTTRAAGPKRIRSAAACFALAGVALGASAGAASAAIPPELLALEQQAQTLHVSSERFSLAFTIKAPLSRDISITGVGAARMSPPAAEVTESSEGRHVDVRVLGHSVYIRYAGLARLDGGRPWVRGSSAELGEQNGFNLGAAPQSISGAFTLLNSATESVRNAGPVTIDGHSTTEFVASVDLSALFSRFGPKLVQQLQRAGGAKTSVALYLASDGLPVRTSVSVAVKGSTITATSDILATNVPVSVSAPAKRTTISEAEFVKLRRKLGKH